MSKADVLQLVSDLSAAQSDDVEVGVLYDEVIRELGFYEVLTNLERRVLPASANGIFKQSPSTLRSLEIAWNQRRLDRVQEYTLRAVYGATWRSRVGDPMAVTVWDESEGELRLVPRPREGGEVQTLRTETRDELPYWLELPVALMVTHREFMRESNHQDVEFAGAALGLAHLFLNLVGVELVLPPQGGGQESAA